MKCSTCKAWQKDGVDGICRRNSPRPDVMKKEEDMFLVWPRTNPDDWCVEGYEEA